VANEIAKKYNKPAFIIVHENAKRLEEHLQFSDTQKWKIAGAFSVNRKNIGILKNTFKSVSYLPNTYNDSLFVPLNKIEVRNQLGLPKDKQIILNVANYTIKDKNQLNLIDAFHRYHEKNKNTMLYLIGNDAGDKGKIRDHIENLNLESVIVIVGSIRNNVLPIWMNTADIFILPSNNESFGIVQVEALACGIPVVATRNGGSEEILNEEIGVLSEGKDAESLCKAIEKANLIKWDKEKIAQSSDSFKRKRYSAIFIDKIKFILNEEVSI
jgi:glycosyltransferase involved in cell wall biosynthesis